METVTRKSEVKIYLDQCIHTYKTKGTAALAKAIRTHILSRKVKFPLLEYCAHTLHQTVADEEQIDLCDTIEAYKTEGGNVLLGIILQDRLEKHYLQSIQKATEYISKANAWYVCDIIGERVYGYALLTMPEPSIPEIRKLSSHSSHWVVRSVGAGAHYAIKKGLGQEDVTSIFKILLTQSNAKHKEIRQGIGWAAKTTARFHPDIIASFENEIQDSSAVANWFRKKIEIGLNRNKYAQRD
ncbi:MAG: DNA alkylation repair protein [Chitinophagales bacterium]|nr:DNA alkylation repair protein [Chitinophagales bacterium]